MATPIALVWTLAALLALGAAACGCCQILYAGRCERLGRLEASRRLVRSGGKLLFLGTVAQLALLLVTLLSLPGRVALGAFERAPAALALAPVALGLAGFVGLLAGLAGKPRPSGLFVALLYAGGLVALFLSARAVLH